MLGPLGFVRFEFLPTSQLRALTHRGWCVAHGSRPGRSAALGGAFRVRRHSLMWKQKVHMLRVLGNECGMPIAAYLPR